MLLAPGQRIADYTVIKSLAVTKCSQIYLVSSEKLHKPFVLKLSAADESDHLSQNVFALEAKILLELSSDTHIAKLMHVGQYQKHEFLLMHYYPSSLLRLLDSNNGALVFSASLDLIEQILVGLSAVHKQKILHLDLKPDNILLDNSQQVFIADFNNAYVQNDSSLKHSLLTNNNEDLIIPRISLQYASPELKRVAAKQLSVESLQPASDLYAIGIIWYQMLSGSAQLDAQHLPHTLDGLAPNWAIQLIVRLLKQEVQERPQSAKDCLAIIKLHNEKFEELQNENQTISIDVKDVSAALDALKTKIEKYLLAHGILTEDEKNGLCLLYAKNLGADIGKMQAIETLIGETKADLIREKNLSAWFAWTEYIQTAKHNIGQTISPQRYREILQVGRASRPDKPEIADQVLKKVFSTPSTSKLILQRAIKYSLLIIVAFIVLFWLSKNEKEDSALSNDLPANADGLHNDALPVSEVSPNNLTSSQIEKDGVINKKQINSPSISDESRGVYKISGRNTEISLYWTRVPELADIRVLTTEVSNELYAVCVEDGYCRETRHFSTDGLETKKNVAQLPKTNISWHKVMQEFIPWINDKTGLEFDLPTYEQWQHFVAQDSIEQGKVNCQDCQTKTRRLNENRTIAVTMLEANSYGLYHVYGNVQEWLKDCWRDSDIIGTSKERCDQAMVAGGSWYSQQQQIIKSPVNRLLKNAKTPTTGFRLIEHVK